LADEPPLKDHLALFREYAELERKRPASGVTPLEYQRWLDLDQRLGHKFEKPDHSARCPALLRVEFQSAEHFRDSYVTELSRGGIFVNTPFAPEIGTELVLVLRIVKDDRSYDLPGVDGSARNGGPFQEARTRDPARHRRAVRTGRPTVASARPHAGQLNSGGAAPSFCRFADELPVGCRPATHRRDATA